MPQDKKQSSNPLIRSALNIRNMINNLGRSTYYSDSDPRNSLEVIRRDADEAIDNLINSSIDVNGTHISGLYTRLGLKQKDSNDV